MTKNRSQWASIIVPTSMALSISAIAAEQPLTEGDFTYSVENGKATVTSFFGTASDFMFVPSELGGYPVTTVGNGEQILYSNNRTRGVMLFPDSVTTISNRAVYDYNETYYFSIPSSVTTIEDGATSSIAIAEIAGEEGSLAEEYATQIGIGFSSDVVSFSINAEDGGSIESAGNYLLPMHLERDYNLNFDVSSDLGYKIVSLTMNGKEIEDAAGLSNYTLDLTLAAVNTSAIKINATFEIDETVDIEALLQSADDNTDEVDYPVYGASSGKYANTRGVNCSIYMATAESGETVVYELVDTFASTDGSLQFSTEDEVHIYAAERGYVQGADYDYIHVYNYQDESDSLSGVQGIAYYVAYLYKTYEGSLDNLVAEVGSFESANEDFSQYLNTSSLYAQDGAEITISNATFNNYSHYQGPSEGPNFYGGASALLANSGAIVTLNNPIMNGSANIAHANYDGIFYITDGEMLGTAQGAHGPYVAYGGEVYVNAETTENPGITERAEGSAAYIERDKETQAVTLVDNLQEGQSSIVTTQHTGTILATDAGGGTIVANEVVAKAYGSGSAGVYSIGSNEGFVYVYNSDITSYLDAGIVSASGGYVYAENSIISGLEGIKLRAGQNSETMSEVHVKNSKVIAYFDTEEMERVFDVYTPEQAKAIQDTATADLFSMNLFMSRESGEITDDVIGYWFSDGYSKAPGAMGGNMLATIYTQASKTPVVIESTKLVNQNYQEYKDADGSKAQNLLVSSEANGTANIVFINNNSDTQWDVTGESEETTEIVGDFYIAEASEGDAMGMPGGMPPGEPPEGFDGEMPMGEPPAGNPPGGMADSSSDERGNYLSVRFENSEWQGTVRGVSQHASLTFDVDSSWVVTSDVTVDTLTVTKDTVIKADSGVTLNYQTLVITDGDEFEFGKNITAVQVELTVESAE